MPRWEFYNAFIGQKSVMDKLFAIVVAAKIYTQPNLRTWIDHSTRLRVYKITDLHLSTPTGGREEKFPLLPKKPKRGGGWHEYCCQ
jgi:hypothetical protein